MDSYSLDFVLIQEALKPKPWINYLIFFKWVFIETSDKFKKTNKKNMNVHIWFLGCFCIMLWVIIHLQCDLFPAFVKPVHLQPINTIMIWYKLVFVLRSPKNVFWNFTGSFECFLSNTNLFFLFLSVTSVCTLL